MESNVLLLQAKNYIWNEDYKRVVEGKRLNLMNEPYTIDYIHNILFYFEDIEEYEKCTELHKVIKTILNHNSNYTK